MKKVLWGVVMSVLFVGMIGAVGLQLVKQQKQKKFDEQIELYREALRNSGTIIKEAVTVVRVEWDLYPIQWDDAVTAYVAYQWVNTETGEVAISQANTRIWVNWDKLQYQISTPGSWDPLANRTALATYNVPMSIHENGGIYELQLCSKFESDGVHTAWECVPGPTVGG